MPLNFDEKCSKYIDSSRGTLSIFYAVKFGTMDNNNYQAETVDLRYFFSTADWSS